MVVPPEDGVIECVLIEKEGNKYISKMEYIEPLSLEARERKESLALSKSIKKIEVDPNYFSSIHEYHCLNQVPHSQLQTQHYSTGVTYFNLNTDYTPNYTNYTTHTNHHNHNHQKNNNYINCNNCNNTPSYMKTSNSAAFFNDDEIGGSLSNFNPQSFDDLCGIFDSVGKEKERVVSTYEDDEEEIIQTKSFFKIKQNPFFISRESKCSLLASVTLVANLVQIIAFYAGVPLPFPMFLGNYGVFVFSSIDK